MNSSFKSSSSTESATAPCTTTQHIKTEVVDVFAEMPCSSGRKPAPEVQVNLHHAACNRSRYDACKQTNRSCYSVC